MNLYSQLAAASQNALALQEEARQAAARRYARRENSARSDVLRVLKDAQAPLLAAEIVSLLPGRTKNQVANVLSIAVAEGAVQRTGLCNHYRYYILKEPA